MKKKFFSVVLSICLFFGGLFSFSGCSLVSEDTEKVNSNVVMKIGDTNITKADLINAFYSYYQNNSSYFSYYDDETIEESFYTWFKVKTMVEQLSKDALYDANTNTDGYIYYTNEDAKTVWEYVEDYFYSQVTSYEKALYTADSTIDEEDYPSWVKDEEEEDEETGFEVYTSPLDDVEFTDRAADVAVKLTDSQVYEKIAALKENLFKYVESTDEDGNETKKDISSTYIQKRNQGYTNYMQGLISNAKANNKSTDKDEVFKAEVLRIYNAYYESQISVIFQNYWTQEYLLDHNGNGDKTTLNDSVIVSTFLNKYYTDAQTYQIQDSYVTKMESSDGASLLMYNYNGRYYYFSVQHILVKFSDYLTEQMESLPGYSTDDSQKVLADDFNASRNALADDFSESMLSAVNTSAEKDSIVTIGDYYYYDETKADIWDETTNPNTPIYYGYVKLSSHTFNASTKSVDYTYYDYMTGDGEAITHTQEGGVVTFSSNDVVLMANKDDILEAYQANYNIWFDLAEDVFDGTKTVNDAITLEDKKYESIKYVFDTAKNIRGTETDPTRLSALKNELRKKVASYLFIELEWFYSGDSLDNEISNKIGYIISSEPDNNMNWMVDFVEGAQAIIADMNSTEENPSEYYTADDDGKATYTKTVVSNYGYHIMKVENIFDLAHQSIIDLSSVTAEYDLTNGSDYVNEVIALMKKTYICSTSNETLYDYIYDDIYTGLVGSSSSSGSYFLVLEYEWLANYYQNNKIETIKKLSYDELIDSLS